MSKLAHLSLANRALVALGTLLIAVVGLFSMTQLKQELIPPISIPQSTIITVLPGASPEAVDEQVSVPLSRALVGVANVESINATSQPSVSIVSVSYKYGIDSVKFEQDLNKALGNAVLPANVEPEILAGSIADIPVVFMSVYSTDDAANLKADLDRLAIPVLEKIPGVRAAAVTGGAADQITIIPDMATLAQHGLSVQSITDALNSNGLSLPVGSITENGETLSVQSGISLQDVDELNALPLIGTAPDAGIVTIGDVASVNVAPQDQTSINRTNGEESLGLNITATPDGDIVAISHAVQDALPGIIETMGEGVSFVTVFDQAPFIEESIQHLAIEGVLGLVFAVLVILVFLLSVRSTIVTAVSIPLSVLVTFVGLNMSGYSLNMLTLGALTIAIGRVVDDSIVVIENIKRHLSYGEEKSKAILTAVREVAGAITASTLTTVMVFVPIALVGGMVGELFAPFAFTVAIAMLSSLLVALTIVPVLAYWFLGQPVTDVDPVQVRAEAEEAEQRSRLQRAYTPILNKTQKHPVITLVAAGLLMVITVAMTPLMKVDFLGNTGQNMLTVTQEFAPGTDLESISEAAVIVENELMEIDGVVDIMFSAGTGGDGMAMMMGGGGASGSYIVNTDASKDQVKLQAEVRERIEALNAGGEITVGDLGAAMFAGSVDVIITAPDDATLAEAGDLAFEALKDTAKTTEVSSDRAAEQPVLQVTVNRETAAALGLSEVQVTGIVANALSPQSVGSLRHNAAELEIFIITTTPPQTTAELEQLLLPSAAGMIPLSDVATVERVEVPTSIARENAELVTTISLVPEEGELGAVTANVDKALKDLQLPAGADAEIGGLSAMQADSFRDLGLAMLIAIAIVYMLMVATFKSLLQPLILLVSVPFAATGALVALLITGVPLGVASLIGLLMLIGIVVTNAIVLIDLINQYRRQGRSLSDAVYHGSRQRLRPILMTALATIFALIPMASGIMGSSGFISQDLAIVVIGGLFSSTILTLVLVPVLYSLSEGRKEKSAAKRVAKREAKLAAHREARLAAQSDGDEVTATA